ncbi:hypothetical protein CASFOL_031408 [Castilleja foliolosa]|uniref:Uncharacterized protein n=1 Tax=Castilleja foliolosa TaxID=1961234 RepID=A0ABD3C4M1_9LAMI
MATVQKIAKRVSGRGGGLESVQSMALAHGKGIIEVACNLLDTSKVGGDEVQREVERLAREEGLVVGEGYYTDLSQGKLIENYLKLYEEKERYDVWVMKDYGVEDSWIKLISFEDEECFFCRIGYNLRPVSYMKDKTQILLQRTSSSPEFLIFDFTSNSMKRVEIHGLTGALHAQFIPTTIFRLHDNCDVDGSVTTNSSRRRRRMKRTSNMNMSDTNVKLLCK